MKVSNSEGTPAPVTTDLNSSANGCFVCGPSNPIGLGLTFRLVGEVCHAEFTPVKQHMGYDNVTHGGILFSLLDDVMANCLLMQGIACFTGRADIRYREQLPIGTPVRVEGQCLKKKGRLAQMQGHILRQDNSAVVAEATASFMLIPKSSKTPLAS